MSVAETTAAVPDFLLPPAAYTSAEWLEDEQAALFHHSWSLVADVRSLAEVGDQVATVVGHAPIVVVRTEQGLRAHHNVCRHRGMTVVQGEGCASSLRCPYHGWEWDLEGTLVRVPQRKTQFPDLEPEALGLHPAAVGEWEGMVFVNPDPDAPDLETSLAGLGEHLGSFRPGLLTEVAQVRIEAGCNWKLFVENHIDVYHLWYLHEDSLADFDHTRFEHHELGANWASYEPLRAELGGLPFGSDVVRHLDARDRDGIQAHMFFPNTLMAASATFFTTYAIRPITPERSWIDLRVRAEPDADVDALVAGIRSFIDEDVQACEQVQAALRGPRFAVGPLAHTHERPIATFHGHLLEALALERG